MFALGYDNSLSTILLNSFGVSSFLTKILDKNRQIVW